MSWLIAVPLVILSAAALATFLLSFFIEKQEPYDWPEDIEEERW